MWCRMGTRRTWFLGRITRYASYHNGQLVECTTFHLRYQPQPNGEGEMRLFTKVANSLWRSPATSFRA